MPRSLAIRSLTAAAREFGTVNDALLSATDHHGVTWEPVRERYGVRAEGWAAAFKACVGRVGGQWSWAAVDMATLRACVPGLELPAWAYEATASAAERAWVQGMGELDGWADEEQAGWYEYGGREAADQPAAPAPEASACDWCQEILEAALALTAEHDVDEAMIVDEVTLRTAPLVCLAGGRMGGRATAGMVAAMLEAPALTAEQSAWAEEIFGIELEPSAPTPPPLPPWAWRAASGGR